MGACGSKGSKRHGLSLAQVAGVYSINCVVLDECCRESAKATVAVGVLSSTSRSSDWNRQWWWPMPVVCTQLSYRGQLYVPM